jgi:hypothetical protein
MMPAVVAALGDVDMSLRCVLSPTGLLTPSCELFPNALDAAVVSGKTEVLSVILNYLNTNVKGKPERETWDEMRSAAVSVAHVLRGAIRLHINDAFKLILGLLGNNTKSKGSMPLEFGSQMMKDCMRNDNVDVLDKILEYRSMRKDNLQNANGSPSQRYILSPNDLVLLHDFGHPRALHNLIESGHLDVSRVKLEGSADLKYPDQKQAYNLVRALVDHGGDYHKTPDDGAGRCLLYEMVAGGHWKDVKLPITARRRDSTPRGAMLPNVGR